MIYHILGSDIPHHNRTVLDFFQQQIAPQLPDLPMAFYLVSTQDLTADYPDLAIRPFPTKRILAKAVVELANAEPQATFLLHGQYNFWIWLAILGGKLPACRLIWHIWGADLYEVSHSWKFKLFYPLRRLAQKKIHSVWATQGDLAYFWKHLRPKQEGDRLIYFPTKLYSALACGGSTAEGRVGGNLTILLGNSGDRSNNHLAALTEIHQRLGDKVRIIVPMGYPANNESYIQQVEQHGKRLFSAENLQILREPLAFAYYQQILTACDLGYFNAERQQGIGTICLLIQLSIPCVLHPKNPFCVDMQINQVPFLTADQLSLEKIAETQTALADLNLEQIGFFPECYIRQWREYLRHFKAGAG